MLDRSIDFPDFHPVEVPDALPEMFWAYWSIDGEFMETTEDRKTGEAWVASGIGYVRQYVWLRPARMIGVCGTCEPTA